MTIASLASTVLLAAAALPQESLVEPAAAGRRPVPMEQTADDSASQARVLRLYDVEGLFGVQELADVLAATDSSDITPQALQLERIRREGERAEQRVRALDELAALVREHVAPSLVDGLDQVEAAGGWSLAVLATEAHHRWIADFLELQRASEDLLVDLSIRLVEGPRGAFEQALRFGDAKSGAVTEAQVASLLAAAEARDDIEVITAPRVLVFNRAPAQVTVLNQVAYVREYLLRHVQPGNVELVDPVVDTVQEGCVIDATPVCIEPDLFAVELDMHLSELVRPIETRKVRVRAGEDEEFEVGVPEVLSVKMGSKLLMEDGAVMALLAAFPSGDRAEGDRDLAILIRLDAVRAEAAGEGAPAQDAGPGSERR